jgi:hypothetical protein
MGAVEIPLAAPSPRDWQESHINPQATLSDEAMDCTSEDP